ncbi:MAG: FAD-dependent oxidoreductase [Nanoarchaeota archaeon]|nr:FAD-dependent oxidoreductase [Nanoarchaeota archaeon]
MTKQKDKYQPQEKILYDTIIIGTGIVGWATAMYAGRLGLKTLIIGDLPGGTIVIASPVENYPGFISIPGKELVDKIEEHAKEYDIHILNDKVTKIEKINQGYKAITQGKKFSTKTIIFCTGTKHRKLNIPGEKEFENKGVHYCALCDGPFYKDKIVGVAGGSDSAAKEALMLTEFAKRVYIIYRKEKIRAEPVNTKRIEEKAKQDKIEIINNTNITEIKGKKQMEKVIFDKPHKGSKEFKLDALFIDIGYIPLSELAHSIGVKINDKGEIVIDKNSKTNIKGVFAAGDVTETEFKQAITGVGEGVQAVYQAYKYIKQA